MFCLIPLFNIFLSYPLILFNSFYILKPCYNLYSFSLSSLYSPLYFIYSLPLFLLSLLYLPALQFNKCIYITSSMLSGFVFPLLTSIYSYSVVVIILQMCLSLYSLLPECLDALPHVPEALYHLLIYFPLLYGFH